MAACPLSRHAGSLGVRFLNLNAQQGVIVLKQGDLSTATEYFCSLVLQQLNIRCPTIRVLSLDNWQKAVKAAAQVTPLPDSLRRYLTSMTVGALYRSWWQCPALR
jgi:hypothetical protein